MSIGLIIQIDSHIKDLEVIFIKLLKNLFLVTAFREENLHHCFFL